MLLRKERAWGNSQRGTWSRDRFDLGENNQESKVKIEHW